MQGARGQSTERAWCGLRAVLIHIELGIPMFDLLLTALLALGLLNEV